MFHAILHGEKIGDGGREELEKGGRTEEGGGGGV
jgi:hypothetical protein